MTDCMPLRRCLCCGNTNLKLTLDLGSQPLANSFKATVAEPENTYPLAVNYCGDCSKLAVMMAHS